jgi:cobalamin biosynthesis Co2+ chelatase CbiK
MRNFIKNAIGANIPRQEITAILCSGNDHDETQVSTMIDDVLAENEERNEH